MVNRASMVAAIIIVTGGKKGTEFIKLQNARHCAKCPTYIDSFIPCNSSLRKKVITEETEAQGRVSNNFFKVKKLVKLGVVRGDSQLNSGLPDIQVRALHILFFYFFNVYFETDYSYFFPTLPPSSQEKAKIM